MRVFISILYFLSSLLVTAAEPTILSVNLTEVRGTQLEIGMERVARKTDKYFRKWKDTYPDGKKSFEEFVAHELVVQKRFPAVLDPDGNVYILDGHHRSYTFLKILKHHPELLADANFEVEVVGDFRGKTKKEFARGLLLDLGKGYFPPEIRNQNLSPKKLVTLLPEHLEDLQDSPMRSLMGEVFDELNIEADYLADYIQFYLGEKIEALKLDLDSEDFLAKGNIEKVSKAIFVDRELVDYLIASPRSPETSMKNSEQIIRIMNEILEKNERKQLVSPAKLKGKCLITLELLFR